LRAAYAKDDTLKLWIKKFISLVLVPKNIVEPAFHLTNLKCPASYEPTQVARFSDYVLKYYVGDSDTGTQALFPVSLWNHFDNDGPRTNNPVEGFNFRMGKYLETHSNIWTFMTKLKKEESSAALKYFRIFNGTYKFPPRRTCDIQRDLDISKTKCKYLAGELNISEYLTNLTKTVHDFSE
jgi:hypothetical protein